MAKNKRVNIKVEGSKKPKVNRLKSIKKQEKVNVKQNSENKSKNQLVDNVMSQLKNKMNRMSEIVTLDKQIVGKKSNNRDVANKPSSNQNGGSGKKRNRRANKKKKILEKLVAGSLSSDKNKRQNSVQKTGDGQKQEKKKQRRNKKVLAVNNANTKPKVKNVKQGKNQDVSKDLRKGLNIDILKKMLKEKENETQVNKKSDQARSASPLSLRDRMMAQLKASRFRFLNEQMYNSDSSQSKKFFQDDPQAFYTYHEGYKSQVDKWPVNPLDVIIDSITKMPKEYVIADFGCGDAKLADSVPQTVHSFDLVAVNDKVKACDMAHTPLLIGRTNVVVFCLSLMGSNLGDYILEANRVLEKNGILKIAEVESRFEKVDDFIKTMTKYGFDNTWTDLSNNLFYFMDFKKTKDVLKKDANKLPALTLKSCLYKKR
ncbi:ribosomal RNA-processing protein 8 [Copidosoma floridanum]|uniref:ribosomal RNA-processing protein 8 n=1 Tax=Copidosoma floridanum TaxID=29053 RepID=UPI0006C9A24D|nr:ribosomal RNA-processing protein 8 [Copidosoma floridanum]